jgi:hypothetical protein
MSIDALPEERKRRPVLRRACSHNYNSQSTDYYTTDCQAAQWGLGQKNNWKPPCRMRTSRMMQSSWTKPGLADRAAGSTNRAPRGARPGQVRQKRTSPKPAAPYSGFGEAKQGRRDGIPVVPSLLRTPACRVYHILARGASATRPMFSCPGGQSAGQKRPGEEQAPSANEYVRPVLPGWGLPRCRCFSPRHNYGPRPPC